MTGAVPLPDTVHAAAADLAARAGPADPLPSYLTDLAGLRDHARRIRAAVPGSVQVLYAAKANPDPDVLTTLAGPDGPLDGVEVASAGELRHVRTALPQARLVFGGPGKTPADLVAALDAGVHRVHVESAAEAAALLATCRSRGRTVEVLLRANPALPPVAISSGDSGPTSSLGLASSPAGPVLTMGGRASPFGMDPAGLRACLTVLAGAPQVQVRGLHVHLASGLDADALGEQAAAVLAWAHRWARSAELPLTECNLGGGMAVDYADPARSFDWARFGERLCGLGAAHPGVRLAIEPGRAVTAYAGYYLTRVLDIKHSHGETFAVLAGGTHHLRTPAAKGHDQPFAVLPVPGWPWPWPRPPAASGRVTLVGQLCTPKDVLARRRPVSAIRPGDAVAFAMAGAYAWNISHRDFLMHPAPAFHRIR